MATLSPHEIVPAGVALRLHRIYFDVDHEAAARGERPALTQAAIALQEAGGRGLDEHAAMADCAALTDYLAAHRFIDLTVFESRDVVPWCYRTYRGRPAEAA